jgi:transposase
MMIVGFEGNAMGRGTVELAILYGNHTFTKAKRFALTVLLLKESIEPETISRIVGVSKRHVYNYRKMYITQGTAAIENDTRYRPASELETHKDMIKEGLSAHPVATASEASERILSLTGIKRSPTQVRALMHRLGLKPLKAAAIPAKANPVVQSEFLETSLEPRMQEAEEGKRILLFMDAAHFVWQLYIGVLWCIKRIFIPAASGRTRINVLGAYNPIKNELIKIINRSYITSTEVIKLLVKIRAAYPDQAITIVLDNAKYQRCNAATKKATALSIELLFLPSYSPNLNLIERLWRFVKKDCLYSKYYKTANDFEAAIVNCLGKINTVKKHKLKSLMTLKFQIFPGSSAVSDKSLCAAA